MQLENDAINLIYHEQKEKLILILMENGKKFNDAV